MHKRLSISIISLLMCMLGYAQSIIGTWESTQTQEGVASTMLQTFSADNSYALTMNVNITSPIKSAVTINAKGTYTATDNTINIKIDDDSIDISMDMSSMDIPESQKELITNALQSQLKKQYAAYMKRGLSKPMKYSFYYDTLVIEGENWTRKQ